MKFRQFSWFPTQSCTYTVTLVPHFPSRIVRGPSFFNHQNFVSHFPVLQPRAGPATFPGQMPVEGDFINQGFVVFVFVLANR